MDNKMPKRQLTDLERVEILNAFKKGATKAKLTREYNVCAKTIYKICNHGELERKKYDSTNRCKLDILDKLKIIQKIKLAGDPTLLKLNDIRKELNTSVSKSTLSRFINSAEFKNFEAFAKSKLNLKDTSSKCFQINLNNDSSNKESEINKSHENIQAANNQINLKQQGPSNNNLRLNKRQIDNLETHSEPNEFIQENTNKIKINRIDNSQNKNSIDNRLKKLSEENAKIKKELQMIKENEVKKRSQRIIFAKKLNNLVERTYDKITHKTNPKLNVAAAEEHQIFDNIQSLSIKIHKMIDEKN